MPGCRLYALAAAIVLQLPAVALAADAHYTATLKPLNVDIAHARTTGHARFDVHGDTLKIDIEVHGAPAGMVHWQHFHGFVDSRAAACPGAANDANHDGIIDLIETETISGTTMVPFTAHPASMDVPHGDYPKADAKGDYHYTATVSLKGLDAAFAKAFPGQQLDLDRRAVFIHGVPADTRLPASVASLGPIPAQVTLPIACGRIERVRAR